MVYDMFRKTGASRRYRGDIQINIMIAGNPFNQIGDIIYGSVAIPNKQNFQRRLRIARGFTATRRNTKGDSQKNGKRHYIFNKAMF